MVATSSLRARAVTATLLMVAALLLSAAPAQAHTKGGPAASDYLTTLREITPSVPGLTVRVVQGGTRLELNNRTGTTVEVLGYSAEPYLRITSNATYVNTHSPSAYRNEDLAPAQATHHPTTDSPGTNVPPNWQRLTKSPRARWHDHRTHWMSDQPPPVVQRAPKVSHRIASWNIALRVGDKSLGGAGVTGTGTPLPSTQPQEVQLRGTLDYLPPPHTGLWWAGMLAVLAGIVAAGFVIGRMREGSRYMTAGLGGLLLLAAAAELIDCVGRALDLGATGLGIVGQLLTSETYGTLTALAALASAGLALRNHAAAPFALALSAACLTVLGACTDVAVFSHSRATVPWSGDLARLCTAATLALGAAVAIGAWRLIVTAAPVRRGDPEPLQS